MDPSGAGRFSPNSVAAVQRIFDLSFELPYAFGRIRQLRRFCFRETGLLAPIDLILAHPPMENGGADGGLDSGSGDRFAGTDEGYAPESKLRR
ncbi:hypothetical protein ACFVWF_28260 [Rhodococcus qingshengii]|uniref:hypothetical protein n=1 Tax=Rhodococcus qingshengii TaxID=334542 RepID=UPI0036DC4706